jgi:energy-coupling factor transport system permease protein
VTGPPGPLLALAAALSLLVLAASQPLVLVACATGAVVLVAFAPGPRLPALIGAALAVVTFTLLNPFVAVQGNTVIWSGPHIPVLDTEVTVEELVYGACAGLRMATVGLACALVVLRCDPDRLTALGARILPRSALTVALAARLVPTLVRDAGALGDAARARGLALDAGGRAERVRARARLAAPLLASGLERGLEVAEAMTARGYGAGPRTRLPVALPRLVERLVYAPAGALAAVAAALVYADAAGFRFYDTLGPMATRPAVLAGVAAALSLVAAALLLERWTPRA